MISMFDLYKGKDFIFSGRTSLSRMWDICSEDPLVLYFQTTQKEAEGAYKSMILTEYSPDEVIIGEDGEKYSSLNKSLYDLCLYDYDDSAVYEAISFLSKEEINNFKEYIKDKPKSEEILRKYM